MKPTVVHILSTNFAGSHFLSLLVGSHSQCTHLGELRQYRKAERVSEGKACPACGDQPCTMLNGVTHETVCQVYEQIAKNLNPATPVLVDTSKKVKWARRFVDHPEYDQKYIHLIRDPRALVRRWDLHYQTPPQVSEQRRKWARRNPGAFFYLLFARPRYLYAYKWLAQNKEISRFIAASGHEALTVTYMDLAKSTEPELGRIMNWIGLELEEGQSEYWNFDHHGTQKPDYDWIRKQKARYFDTRWKDHLTEDESRHIREIGKIHTYLNGLGITLTDDGLTRNGR